MKDQREVRGGRGGGKGIAEAHRLRRGHGEPFDDKNPSNHSQKYIKMIFVYFGEREWRYKRPAGGREIEIGRRRGTPKSPQSLWHSTKSLKII